MREFRFYSSKSREIQKNIQENKLIFYFFYKKENSLVLYEKTKNTFLDLIIRGLILMWPSLEIGIERNDI